MDMIALLTLLTQMVLFVVLLSLVTRMGPITLVWRIYDQVARGIGGAPVQRLSQITPQLWVGGQHSERGWAQMQAMGITAIVNMREAEYDDRAAGIVLERYLHLPTVDGTAPTIAHLQAGVSFISEEIANGGCVYIHCASGFHRAPTMAMAYLMSTGLSLDDALATIKKVRPFARPIRVQKAQLARFSEQLGES